MNVSGNLTNVSLLLVPRIPSTRTGMKKLEGGNAMTEPGPSERAITHDAAYETVYRLGNEEGVVAGQSSGAAVCAALQVAQEITEGVIVVILSDLGYRYLSTNLWIGWREWRNRAQPRVE